MRESDRAAGYTDDIGDISWNVPTATLSFPSNMPGLPRHNWANAVAMATPIAHKDATQGAIVQSMIFLDFMVRSDLVEAAWDYFRDVQTADLQYAPFIGPTDQPAIEMNAGILDEFREEIRKFCYDSGQYDSYLDQLGVSYPTLRQTDGRCSTTGSVNQEQRER